MKAGSRIAAVAGIAVLAAFPAAADPLEVPRAPSAIAVDGDLGDPAWDGALRIALDYEVEPGENVPPPVRTVCLLTYDDRHVYVGFRADDPDPSAIRARYSDRDRAWNDDWVGVVFDTFDDQRRAYELFATPLGVQLDALNDEVGNQYDTTWNAIWTSAARITTEGYEVEMAIPFHQVRFVPGDGGKVWGFDAVRNYPRQQRHRVGAFPRRRGSNSYLAQTIKLVGFEGVTPGKNLEAIPTVTASRTDARADLGDPGLEAGDVESDLGVSVRWGMTPNVSLNAAVNPDFSQVEADVLQLDINEQFALFYEETRPFFKEGADYFNTDLQLVHTRDIVDPAVAGKLTGKNGDHTWGVFTARDDRTAMIVPGPEGSSSGLFDLANQSSVGRYRRDFGSGSTVGGTVTDRRGDGYANTVASADTVYRITDADLVKASVAWSRTRYDDSMVETLGVPGGPLEDGAVALEYHHGKRGGWVNARYDDFGDDFRSDLGFRPRVGFRSLWAGGARIWWGEEGRPWYRRAWGAGASRAEFQDGSLLEETVQTWANARGPRESVVEAVVEAGRRVHEGVEFEVWTVEAEAFVQATSDAAFALEVLGGDWIDFAHARPARRWVAQPSFRYTAGRHLWVHVTHIASRLDVAGGTLFRVHAPEVRLIHQFDTRAFVRLVLQYARVDRDPSLYAEPVDARTEDLFAQALFSYKVNPQTALYLGYSDRHVADDAYDLTATERTLFLKVGYAFVR